MWDRKYRKRYEELFLSAHKISLLMFHISLLTV